MPYNKSSLHSALFSMQDVKYKEFHSALIPTVSPDAIIGVRTPQLRSFAKNFAKSADAEAFLCDLPHTYYEENNLHSFIIESIKDYTNVIYELDRFLPYVDNWATCDMMRPKVLKSHTDELLADIHRWIASNQTYTVRFAIGALMSYYLDDSFSPDILSTVAAIKSDEYYVNMMIAWFFATALAKQYVAAIPYITENRLVRWIHNKTIQKSVESNRISKEQKEYLKTLKIK